MRSLICVFSVVVVFWNVENLFEKRPGFNQKCNDIAKTLMEISDREGAPPDAIGFAEVENRRVLNKLLWNTGLSRLGYKIIHYESPDRRGIDCALLLREDKIHLVRSSAHHLKDSAGRILPTRDILLVETDSLAILVNHHPSKVGSGGAGRRLVAMDRMTCLMDSLERSGGPGIVSVGDFNDNLWGPFTQGTIKYNGEWEKIDGHFARGVEVHEEVWASPRLSCPDTKFGGVKPHRSYQGPRYLGGVSDHYPIILTIFVSNRNQTTKK